MRPESDARAVRIAVMSRAPVAGRAKTRLAPALGERGAARLQRLLLRRALQTALSARLGGVTLWCEPDTRHPAFRSLARMLDIRLRPQCEGDLGERMAAVFASDDVRGAADQPMLLTGTDCPALEPWHLRQAAESLASGQDAYFLPAEDGGYVLVGLRRPRAEVFSGIDWSTDRVMRQTRERMRGAGMRWVEGPTLWDVDTPADLARWGDWTHTFASSVTIK